MTIEMALPQVLEHVDLDKWERPAKLLQLISVLQTGPNPVPLGRRLLEATGRTTRQAKYDHEVLVRLAERDRILMRWPGRGRRPDAWAITNIGRWRNVPWISPRRVVISVFLDPLPDAAVALWAKRAARAAGLETDGPILQALKDAGLSVGLSVGLKSPGERHRSTTPQDERETLDRLGHNATDRSGPSQLAVVSKETTSSLEEEERAAHIENTARHLGRLIARTIGKQRLWGRPHAIVVATVERHPDHLEELRRLASTVVAGTLDPEEAALTFSEAADELALAGWRQRSFSPGSGRISRRDCAECHGSGWIDTDDETSVIRCPACHLASA